MSKEKIKSMLKSRKLKLFFKQTSKYDKKKKHFIVTDHIVVSDKSKLPRGYKGYVPMKYAKIYDEVMDSLKELKALLQDIKQLKKSIKMSYKYKAYTDAWRRGIRQRIERDKREIAKIKKELKDLGVNVKELL